MSIKTARAEGLPFTDIHVRPMLAEEKKVTAAVMRRAFSPLQQLFFSWKGRTLVAEREGQILGATVLNTFPLSGGRKGGIVLWIFTDPAVQGQGAGQALAEAAIAVFDAEGCTDTFACVEGYNTSSSKLWATRGFGILSPGAQFRRYGLGVLPMWWNTFHFIDLGHFLWTRPPADQSDSPALQWWGTLAMNAILIWLALWQHRGFREFHPLYLLMVPLWLLLFLGARTLAMLALAKPQGIALRYRAWESGFPLGIVIALAFGGLYPSPGSFYPTTEGWRYREWLPKLGPVALAGLLPGLILSWGLWALSRFGNLGAGVQMWCNIGMMIGVSFSIFDAFLAFFPFVSFNARRVWDWKFWIWGLLALVTLALAVI
ncbi:MAG: GNAT family N-acetyltransferase [Anaerolineales bacterium]|nr:GNAT family N-acetyltransferase [Anaerolineales bacterium]